MVKRHLKRINAPKTWPIPRKQTIFVPRPQTGAHSFMTGMPLSMLLKDVLGLAPTTRAVKFLLATQDVLVNGQKIKRIDAVVGLMDVLSFPTIKTSYRLLLNDRGRLTAVLIAGDDAALLPLKVIGKTALPGKKHQVTFHNGWTLLSEKKEFTINSTALFSFDKKVKEHIQLDKGAFVLVTSGKHVGTTGVVEKTEGQNVFVKTKDGALETTKRNVFALGSGKAHIKLAE